MICIEFIIWLEICLGDPLPSIEKPLGPYPTLVNGSSGWQVPVVQAYTFGKYVGVLHLGFNEEGHLTSHSGNPVLMDESVDMGKKARTLVYSRLRERKHHCCRIFIIDPQMTREVENWKIPLETSKINKYVGSTKVHLEGSKLVCRLAECNLGKSQFKLWM